MRRHGRGLRLLGARTVGSKTPLATVRARAGSHGSRVRARTRDLAHFSAHPLLPVNPSPPAPCLAARRACHKPRESPACIIVSVPDSPNSASPRPLRITIIGVGLLGGSLALALRAAAFPCELTGYDRDTTLAQALRDGLLDHAAASLREACSSADLVLLCTPVGAILNLLPEVAAAVPAHTVVSDFGSTKRAIVQRGTQLLGSRFIGGHPMAGRETSGLQHASPTLFQDRGWILIGEQQHAAPLLAVIAAAGAHPLWMSPDQHDHVLALLSHLPQLLSTALASQLADVFAATPDQLRAAGPGVRDMTRLAASSYALWRDILLTNSDEIDAALSALQQQLDFMRQHLRTREMESLFQQGAQLRSLLSGR